MVKKRKQHPSDSNNTLTKRLHEAFETLQDEGKLEALLRFCEQKINSPVTNNYPSWAKESVSFLSTLNIEPKGWDLKFNFPFMEDVLNLFRNKKWENIEQFKDLINSTFRTDNDENPCNMTNKNITELLLSIERTCEIAEEHNLGELIVSGGVNNLLNILRSAFKDIKQNGDKESLVCLSDDLPVFNVRNDGYLETKYGVRFFLREDKSIDGRVAWNSSGTDCYKLVLCMKSLLRNNMQQFLFDKEQMNQYSKVMGLSFLKNVSYLFILEASFEEEIIDGIVASVIPKYTLYMKEYNITVQLQVFSLWLDIGYFIHNYVPAGDEYFAGTPYRPTSETPLKNLSSLGELITSTKSEKKRISVARRMKKYKPVVGGVEKHENVLLVQTTSIIKEVEEEERRIIIKLMKRDDYCLYLPQILNIYEHDVEFEHLRPLPKYNSEDILLMLVCDISIALRYLHSLSIIHRDVKPSNTMIRCFNTPNSFSWFVLIDFGLSFKFKKENDVCYQVTKTAETIVNANVGTSIFKAPEVVSEKNYDEKIDIYSLGASILYLKNRTLFEAIYSSNDEPVHLQKVMASIQWDIKELGEMVMKMVDLDPKQRPTAQQLEEYFSTLYNKKRE